MAQLVAPSDESTSQRPKVVRRLRWLAAAHMLFAAVPTAICFVPAQIRFLPLLWALLSVQLGQMMLLGFWAAMGAGRTVWRISLASLACVYLAIWPTLGFALSRVAMQQAAWKESIGEFRNFVVLNWTIVLLVAAAFLGVRRWFNELRLAPDADDGSSPGRVQYSILSILVVTAVVSILLGLMRIALPSTGSDWRIVASTVLAFVALLIDALCAEWAVLAAGRARWRISFVFFIATLLGLAQSLSGELSNISWWLVPGWILAWVLPITVAVASLWVVRTCGYRLVPKRPAASAS